MVPLLIHFGDLDVTKTLVGLGKGTGNDGTCQLSMTMTINFLILTLSAVISIKINLCHSKRQQLFAIHKNATSYPYGFCQYCKLDHLRKTTIKTLF
jgi:hypothetical protein